MKEKFVLLLKEHRKFGSIIYPVKIKKKLEKDFFEITESVVYENINSNPDEYTNIQKQIVKLCNEYSDNQLTKLFSKDKKKLVQNFVNSANDELIELQIRPYIEKRIVKILDLLKENNIPLYFKFDKYDNIYPEEEIFYQTSNAQTIFNFIKKKNETQYFLTIKAKGREIKLLDKPATVLSNSPCRIVIENDLLFFEDIDAKKLQPFFNKSHIAIPKRVEKKYYESFVKKSIENYQVNHQGFIINNPPIVRKAILLMENDWKSEIAFTLYFYYNDLRFLSTSKREVVVNLDYTNDKIEFKKTKRDLEWEKDIIENIDKIMPRKENPGVYKIEKTNDSDLEKQKNTTISWLNEKKQLLENIGVFIEQNIYKKDYYTGNIQLNIDVKNKTDWFDIYIIVNIEEYQIPFIRFKNHILNNSREYLLPNGKVFILPDEWFSNYKDLFIFGKKSGSEKLKIKSIHQSILNFKAIEQNQESEIDELNAFLKSKDNVKLRKPQKTKANLRTYQLVGYNWFCLLRKFKMGACLADDMGLGKTLQTLSLLSELEEPKISENNNDDAIQLNLFNHKIESGINNTSLIIAPKSLVHNWFNEIQKFTPQLKTLIYTGNKRDELYEKFTHNDIIITSYGVIRNDIVKLSEFNFEYIVLDESQVIKNPNSKINQAVKELNSNYKIALTGTPIENSLSDLWAQMDFLNSGLLGSYNFFKRYFITPIEKNNDENMRKKLIKLINPFILRRTKKEVLTELPPLTEQTIKCELSEEQEKIYEEEKSTIRNKILELHEKNQLRKSSLFILQGLNRLRQISNHPQMLEDYSHINESGKLEEIKSYIENIISENHKILIFSSYVKHLDIVSKQLETMSIGYEKLTGSTQNRQQIIENFQNDDNIKVFLISIKAGGVGLNLTSADYVFILDPWWNPSVENQAISRAHRMGQNNKVMVYRFISNNTIEEKIRKLQFKKSQLADTFVENENPFKDIANEQILELFD